MSITIGEIVLWLMIGSLIGAFVGRLVKQDRRGYGWIFNTLLGVAGAVVGGGLFKVFRIDLGLGEMKVTFEQLIAALFGSVVVLIVVWGVRTKKKLLFWVGATCTVVAVVVLLSVLSRG